MKTHGEQIDDFQNQLNNLIEYFVNEYDMPLGSMIGVLEITKHVLITNNSTTNDEQEI